jgi:hypothetical protein
VIGKRGEADNPDNPEKIQGDAHYWAIRFLDYVVCEWVFHGRFLAKFWQALSKKIGAFLVMTTAYHPQADSQSEKKFKSSESPCGVWSPVTTRLCVHFAVNTARNFTTGESPSKLLYGTHPRDGSTIDRTNVKHDLAEQFLRDRRDIRAKVQQALKLAQAQMAIYHDRRHSPIKIGDPAYFKLTRKTKRGYRIPYASALDVIKDGLFKVLNKVGKNIFKFGFSASKYTPS